MNGLEAIEKFRKFAQNILMGRLLALVDFWSDLARPLHPKADPKKAPKPRRTSERAAKFQGKRCSEEQKRQVDLRSEGQSLRGLQ